MKRKSHLIYKLSSIAAVSAATMLVMSAPANASLATWYANQNWQPVFSFGGGTATSGDVGTTGATYPSADYTQDEYYQYSGYRPTQTTGFGEGFLGGEWGLNDLWRMQIGVDYSQPGPFDAKGTILQGPAMPDGSLDPGASDTFNYHYSVTTRDLFAFGKVLYTVHEFYHPYFTLGLGAAFNTASNYSTNVGFVTFTRDFNDHNNTAFAYTLGVGVDVDLTQQLRAGIGYRFISAGKVELGSSSISDPVPQSGTLSQNNLYVNEVLAQLTVVFC